MPARKWPSCWSSPRDCLLNSQLFLLDFIPFHYIVFPLETLSYQQSPSQQSSSSILSFEFLSFLQIFTQLFHMALQCPWQSEPWLCSWATPKLDPKRRSGPRGVEKRAGCKASLSAPKPWQRSEADTSQGPPVGSWNNLPCSEVPVGLSENGHGHI